jgi:hypothetical protein
MIRGGDRGRLPGAFGRPAPGYVDVLVMFQLL